MAASYDGAARRLRFAGAAACLVGCLAGTAMGQSDPRFDQFRPTAAKAIGLSDCALVQLRVGTDAERPMEVKVPIGGVEWTLDLRPHSVRSPDFQLVEQRADGHTYFVKPPPENTFRGEITGQPGSIVAGGIMPEGPDEGLYATVIFPDGARYWIQPVSSWVPGAPRALYAIYTGKELVAGPWRCGNDDPAHNHSDDHPPFSDRGTTLRTAQVSIDADFEFFARYGGTGAVSSRVALIWNIVNVQYERETDITHLIGTTLVRSAEPDPYASSDSNIILTDFRDDWNTNRPSSRGDLNQLFTGKEIIGSVIGRAFLGVVCGTSAYGFVQSDFNNNLMSATDLTAHESGHNWSADHCDCSGNGTTVSTMNPFITSINRFTFSNNISTVGQIIAHRNSRSCLVSGGGGTDPRNDACASATPIGPNTLIGWNNSGATTDGPVACGSFGNDIWYVYTAPCDGSVTVNLCGSNHDTVVAAYTGACTALTQLACNDDNFAVCGGNGLQSSITFSVIRGTGYRIRVGGFNSAVGDGLIIVNQAACPAPSNNFCSGAITIGQGDVPFSTIGATTDGPVEMNLCNNAGNAQVLNDIWYRYTAPCTGTVRLSTCTANYDSRLAVYLACPTGANSAIACNDDAGPACGTTRSSLDFASTIGVTYLIRLGGFNGQVGSGTLNVTSLACPPPPNDLCANGLDVSAGGTFTGTILGASNDGAINCGGPNSDIWFRFTAPAAPGTLTVTTCGTHDTGGQDAGVDGILSIHTGCPGSAANQLACNDDWPGSAVPTACTGLDAGNRYDSAVQASLSAGQTVRIRFGRFSNAGGGTAMRLHVSFIPASTGACCCGATCFITTPAACGSSGGTFQGAAACNVAGNNTTPCCRADFNHVGGVSVQDLFDFLAGYFANNGCADVNGNETFGVQDIFDFLALYFGGC